MLQKTTTHSKTKTSFYRRLLVTFLIDSGVNSVPKIMKETGMPRRTAQDTIKNLSELGIAVKFVGGTKNGNYVIENWGAISKTWVKRNVSHLKDVLQYNVQTLEPATNPEDQAH